MAVEEQSQAARRPSSVLFIAALLCANPMVMLILGWSPLLALLLAVLTIVLLQWLWRTRGMSLLTVYATNFAALAGVWLHAEALVRARYHDYVMEDLYFQHGTYYFNRPNLRSRLRDREYAVDYLTNRDGYRIGGSQDPERTVSQVDWLFLGDSYTQGAQVDFEELYTTRLYRQFPDRVVLNAGVSGWGLYESLAFLRARGADLRPATVFVQIANFNDFMKVAPRRAGLSDYLMQSSEAIRLLLQDIKYENPTSLPLGRWVEPFYASDDANRRYNVFYVPTSKEKAQDLRGVSTVLRELAATCKDIGARLVFIQVPTKEQVSYTYLEEVVTGLRIDPRLLDMDRPNRLIRSIADSLGVAVIDPLEQWREAPVFPFFHYDEHLTAVGHEMLATAVTSFLRRSVAESHVRILSTSYNGDRYPQFVPSGDSILFHSPRDGNSELLHAPILAGWSPRSAAADG
ncbi:MAG: SGNH/GDSL hydrolase family protein [Gemmatimonadetes bacterium]|nr:SGNH/GDSL hydrolase family protein [Gemmatimonadota bacterium]